MRGGPKQGMGQGRHRSWPTGGAAKGIPLNEMTPSATTPCNSPPSTRASGGACARAAVLTLVTATSPAKAHHIRIASFGIAHALLTLAARMSSVPSVLIDGRVGSAAFQCRVATSARNVHGGQTSPLPKPAVRSGDWPFDCGALGKTCEIPGGNLIEMTPPLQYAFIDATTDSSARRSSWRRQPCATTLFVCRSCQPRRVINSAHPHNSRSLRPICNEVASPGRPLRRAQQ